MPDLPRRSRTRPLLIVVASLVLTAGLVACSDSEPEDPTAFCDALRIANSDRGALANVDLDDAATIDTAVAELDALADLGPADLDDDLETIADTYREVLEAVVSTAPSARADVLRSLQPQLDEAAEPSRRVQEYGQRTCEIVFEAPAQPTPTPTPLNIDD